jgi:DedD protein
MAQQQQDVETLKRRGRRRLVGAIALVLLAVIVLPWVFDPDPRPSAPPVSVRIPAENEAPFKPKPAPAPAPAPQAEKKSETQYVIAVGAFADAGNVLAKLSDARLPYYTEKVATSKGGVTRVRAGPFASREAAEKALEQLKALGFKPGSVTVKTG